MKFFIIDTVWLRIYYQAMRAFVIILAVFFFWPVISSAENNPFNILGFEIPSIVEEDWLVEGDKIPIVRDLVTVKLYFYLGREGTIDSIRYENANDTVYTNYIRNSLEQLEFYPARYQGKAIPFIVPARIVFEHRYRRHSVNLEFPFTETNCEISRFYLEECLGLNGIELPAVDRFVPYFLGLNGVEEDDDYSFSIYKIDLDSNGSVIDDELELIYGVDYSKTINNAILYSEFSPAVYNGRKMPSSFYLLFRYLKSIEYPTEPWSSETVFSDYRLDNFRMERVLYLDSVINRPIPLNVPNGRLMGGLFIPFKESVEVEVVIGADGLIKNTYLFSSSNGFIAKNYRKGLSKLEFLPARDINGRAMEFTGRLKIEYNNSNEYRVIFDWIPVELKEVPEKTE